METTNTTIREVKRVEDFVRALNTDAKKIKGVSGEGYTYLLGTNQSQCILFHKKYSVTVYFSGLYFSVTISVGKTSFSASVNQTSIYGDAKVTIDSSNIVAFLEVEEEIKTAWGIAKSISRTSLVEMAIQSKKQKIELLDEQRKGVENEIKGLESLNCEEMPWQETD